MKLYLTNRSQTYLAIGEYSPDSHQFLVTIIDVSVHMSDARVLLRPDRLVQE